MMRQESLEMDLEKVMKYCSSMSLLYVEDDKRLQYEMQETFSDLFGQVIVASNGQEGLKKFKTFKEENTAYPDIVFTDIRMPELNGIQMSKSILKLNPDQSIVVLSAHNESDMMIDLINTGISNFLLKPIETVQLYKVLNSVCEKEYQRKQNRQYANELEKLANLDALTGIANRRLFFEKMNESFPKLKAEGTPLCVCIADLDNFKHINDTYGHQAGDGVIKKFVEIVEDALPEESLFARLGGDEFVIAVEMPVRQTSQLINSIRQKIDEVEAVSNVPLKFSVSMGLVAIESSDDAIDELIKRADIMLYKEKLSKR